MPDDRRLQKLSKFLALILRHQPERFALALDEHGWASLSEVMEILHGLPNFRWAARADVAKVVNGKGEGGAHPFQIEGDRIRARFGHSLERPVVYEPCVPPAVLYYGTSTEALDSIRRRGLVPVDCQYIHLSPDERAAVGVSGRHTEQAAIVPVRAGEAYASGIVFHRADDLVYLAKYIPPEFLSVPLGQLGRSAGASQGFRR